MTVSGFCRWKLQAQVTKSNVLRCSDPLASLIGTIFFRNYSPWLHMFDFFGRIEYLSFTTKGMMVFPANIPPARCFFRIFKRTFYMILFRLVYICTCTHNVFDIPNKKGTFWRLPMEKTICLVWAHHGITWGSGKVPLFPAWPCVRRCLCSGCWTGGHRGHRHPGKEPRERKRVVFGVVHRGVLGI